MFSNSQQVKTTFLEKEREASALPSSRQATAQQNLEKLIQAAQGSQGVDTYAATEASSAPRRTRPKTRRALSSIAATTEFESNNSLAGFKRTSVGRAPASEASMASDFKRRPDSGIKIENLESSTDLFYDLALPSEVSSVVESAPPAYVQDIQAEVNENGYGAREHTRLLNQAHKEDFNKKLSYVLTLDATASEREKIEKQVRQGIRQYDVLRQSIYHVLGDYSHKLLRKIRYRLLDLSESTGRINTKVDQELRDIKKEIDKLFSVLDIHLDKQEIALQITADWERLNDTHDQENLQQIFEVLKTRLDEFDIEKAKKRLSRACDVLEKRLLISGEHEPTSGSFGAFKKACRKLQAEQSTVYKNSVFASDDTVYALYEKVNEICRHLLLLKEKSTHSTKDTSTVYQEDSSSYMELASPQGSTVKSSESGAAQEQEKDTTSIAEDTKESTIQNARRSASTIRAPRYRPSHNISRKRREKNTLTQRIAKWRDHTLTNPMDELYTRLSNDIQSFLSDLGDLNVDRHQINTEKNRNLQRRLTTLQRDMQALSNEKQHAKLSKFLEPLLSRVGITWRTIKQFLLNNDKVSNTTLVYLHKALSESQARSTRSIISTSTRQTVAREKRRHSAVFVKEDALIADKENIIDDEQAVEIQESKEAELKPNHLQHSQVRETLKAYGLDVQSSQNPQFAENASQKFSMRTRSYQGEEGEWEDVTTSEKSHNPSVASTIRPNKSRKVRAEVSSYKEKTVSQSPEEAEWEDVTSSGNSYRPTNAESAVRSTKSDKTETERLDTRENRDYDRHPRVSTDRRHKHRSRRQVHQSYMPELLGSRVTITKQNKFLFFKTSVKQVEMSGERYERLCEEDRSWIPNDRSLRKLSAVS